MPEIKEKGCCKDSLTTGCNNLFNLFFTVLVQSYHLSIYFKNAIIYKQCFENQTIEAFLICPAIDLELEAKGQKKVVGY